MHLTGLAVESQRQFLLAVDQDERLRTDALDLLGAKIEAETDAVLGDHQRDLTALLLALVRWFDQADTVLFVKGTGFSVEHVAQIRERVFWVDGRRFKRGEAFRAAISGCPCAFQRFDGLSA